MNGTGSKIAIGVAVVGIVAELIRPGRNSAQMLNAMNRGFAQSIKLAVGSDKTARDCFGNEHRPDDVGYCACWQCPKFDGVSWWQPEGNHSR